MKTPEEEEKEPEWVDVSAVEMPGQQTGAEGSYTNMAELEKSEMAPDSGGYVNAEPINDEDGVLT